LRAALGNDIDRLSNPKDGCVMVLMTGSELQRRRQALGLTREQLAREFGVPRKIIALWEWGDTIKFPSMVAVALDGVEKLAGQSRNDC
jgi:predicted transcriptional regulator